jgi:hypothetical protein
LIEDVFALIPIFMLQASSPAAFLFAQSSLPLYPLGITGGLYQPNVMGCFSFLRLRRRLAIHPVR